MPRSWYVSVELSREITTWEELTVFFTHTFSFPDTNPVIHSTLQHIRDVVLKVVLVAYPVDPHETCLMQSMMECYIVIGGSDDGDDPWNINIPEKEGSWDVATPNVSTHPMNQLLKI